MRKSSFLQLLFPFFLALLVFPALAQSPVVVSLPRLAYSLPAKGLSLLSVDRFDRLYVAGPRQNILQIDTLGKTLNTYSPPIQGHVAMVEAWSPAKISVFYDDRQRVQLLDRFLTPLGLADLRDYTDGTIKASTLSADDRLWLFDETAFRLLKIDTRITSITHETPLELLSSREPHDIMFMREYQSKLYMVDRLSGVYIFDNMGNYQQKLPLPGLSYLGFLGEEMYYLSGQEIRFQHLYTGKTRSLALPPGGTYRQVLLGDRFLYVLSQDTLSAYRWR